MTESSQHRTGGQATGHDDPGGHEADLHSTPSLTWVAVLMMCAGATLIGLCIMSLSFKSQALSWPFFIAGMAIGLVGSGLALRQRIFENVE